MSDTLEIEPDQNETIASIREGIASAERGELKPADPVLGK